MTANLKTGEWVLHCVECGFSHDKMTAAKPVCWNCGARMYLTCAPTPLQIPRIHPPGESVIHPYQRIVCVSEDYTKALEEILRGGKLPEYLSAFQPSPGRQKPA